MSVQECLGGGKLLMDMIHRILAGQPLSPRELRIAGFLVLCWFAMDTAQWIDWLIGKFMDACK
jgi:hypothetical protein